jgi:hypothetical protein
MRRSSRSAFTPVCLAVCFIAFYPFRPASLGISRIRRDGLLVKKVSETLLFLLHCLESKSKYKYVS